jgi:hypothetical protein
MTRVIGKKPLDLTHIPKVETTYDDHVRITTGGFQDGQPWVASGALSVYCARNLILNLRIALRKIRDERTAQLKMVVEDAEKPL